MKNLHSLILVLIVFALLAIAGFRVWTTGLQINTDMFSLLPGLPRIEGQNKLRFLVEGEAEVNAKLTLREALRGLVVFPEADFSSLNKLCRELYPYRAALSSISPSALLDCSPAKDCLRQHLQEQISSPDFSGELFNCDPLLLAPAALKNVINSEDSSELILAELVPNVDVTQIEMRLSEVKKNYPKTEFIWSGFPKFAESSRERFEKEFALMATLSTLGILLIIRWAFSSVILLGVSLLSSLLGFTVGVASCLAFGGEIHSLTLTLGGSLLGACVDYSIHWFAERYWRKELSPKQIWKEVSPALTLGMSTSILAIAPFYFSDSRLLKEFCLFCFGALTGSLCLLAFVPLPQKLNVRKVPYVISHKFFLKLLSLFKNKYYYVVVLLIVIIGSLCFRVDDDLRQLQTPLPQLIADELRISKGRFPNAYLEISGKDDAEKMHILQQTLALLHESKEGAHLPLDFNIPEESLQYVAIEKYKKYATNFSSEIASVMEEFGLSTIALKENLNLKRIDLDLIRKQAPEIFSKSGNLIIPVVNWKEGISLPENVRVIDYRAEISSLFAKDRKQSLYSLLIGYCLIGLLLIVKYRSLLALRLLIPCALSAFVTLAFLSILGYPLNFFTTMALALILGLSVDYAVFFSESKQPEAVSLSIFASAATTAVAFAPLILSDTALLSGIGSCMLIGVSSAMFFSPLAASMNNSRS
jgi:hypothetical protein